MAETLRSLLLLFAGIALAICAIGSFNSLSALRMDIVQFDMNAIGMVLAVHCIGFTVGSWAAPVLIRRLGVRRGFMAMALLCGVAAVLHLVQINPLAWALVRFWFGFGNGAISVCYESWINAATDNRWRGRVLAGYMTINYLGYGGGQLLLRAFPAEGNALFFIVLLCAALACLPVWRATPPVIEDVPVRPVSFLDLLRRAPLGPIGTAAAGLLVGAFFHLGPIFARAYHNDSDFISNFMLTVLISAFLVQTPLGWLSDLIGRRPVLLMLAAGTAFAAHRLAVIPPGQDAAVISALILFGATCNSIYGVSVAIANDAMKSDEMVSVSGHLMGAFGVGTIIAPLAASAMMGWIGSVGLFVFITAICLSFTVIIAGLGLGRRPQTV